MQVPEYRRRLCAFFGEYEKLDRVEKEWLEIGGEISIKK